MPEEPTAAGVVAMWIDEAISEDEFTQSENKSNARP
jgi:hypothetical protein